MLTEERIEVQQTVADACVDKGPAVIFSKRLSSSKLDQIDVLLPGSIDDTQIFWVAECPRYVELNIVPASRGCAAVLVTSGSHSDSYLLIFGVSERCLDVVFVAGEDDQRRIHVMIEAMRRACVLVFVVLPCLTAFNELFPRDVCNSSHDSEEVGYAVACCCDLLDKVLSQGHVGRRLRCVVQRGGLGQKIYRKECNGATASCHHFQRLH